MIASIGQSDLSMVARAGRPRQAALGAFAALLGIVFLLLLAADQAQSVAALF